MKKHTIILSFVWIALWGGSVSAQQTVCAVVSLVIEQELTLERQAFEGRMTIDNALPVPLEDLTIDLIFKDETGLEVMVVSQAQLDQGASGNGALFFHRLLGSDHSLSLGLTNYTGQIAASSVQNIVFLFIPSPEAADERTEGTEYRIGARLAYKVSGTEEVIDVNPASIRVMPMPRLGLDYFKPRYAYGDDPFTPIVEPGIPFSLGVRVRNVGAGVARQLRIESRQPVIQSNQAGLAVTFRILGTEVGNLSHPSSMTVDFGDLPPVSATLARWRMTSSLSGEFTSFNAEVFHSNELGGMVTSLIDPADVRTFELVGDVLADEPGDDGVRDFLARPFTGGMLKLHPSHELPERDVLEIAGGDVTLNPVGEGIHRIQLSGLSGGGPQRIYLKVNDPGQGRQVIDRVVRSDGKILPRENAWQTTRRDLQNPAILYHEWHLFDTGVKSQHTYRIHLKDPDDGNRAPVLSPLGLVFLGTGQPFSLAITAEDPDGDPVIISTGLLPYGAGFIFDGANTGIFSWTPEAHFEDFPFNVEVVASDGLLSSRDILTLLVLPPGTDRLQAWMNEYNVSDLLSSSPGDGYSPLLKYALGLDPTRDHVAGLPVLSVESFDGEDYLTLTLTRRTDDPYLTIQLIAADLLGEEGEWSGWNPVGTEIAVTDGVTPPPGLGRVQWRDSIPVADLAGRQRFLALWVEHSNVPGSTEPLSSLSPPQGLHRLFLSAQRDNPLSIPLLGNPLGYAEVIAHEVMGQQDNASIVRLHLADNLPTGLGSMSPATVGLMVEFPDLPEGPVVLDVLGQSEDTLTIRTAWPAPLPFNAKNLVLRRHFTVQELFQDVLEAVSEATFEHPVLQQEALWWVDEERSTPFPAPGRIVQRVDSGSGLQWRSRTAGTDTVVSDPIILPPGELFFARNPGLQGKEARVLGAPVRRHDSLSFSEVEADSYSEDRIALTIRYPGTLAELGLDALVKPSPSPLAPQDTLLFFKDEGPDLYPFPSLMIIHDGTHFRRVGNGQIEDNLTLQPGQIVLLRRYGSADPIIWTPFNHE